MARTARMAAKRSPYAAGAAKADGSEDDTTEAYSLCLRYGVTFGPQLGDYSATGSSGRAGYQNFWVNHGRHFN
jgi:hypothetical protein